MWHANRTLGPPAPRGTPAPRDPERQARQRMVDLLEYLARVQAPPAATLRTAATSSAAALSFVT